MKAFKDLRLGLFVHYVYFDPARWFPNQRVGVYPSGRKAASLDELAEGCDVEDLARQAAAMKAEYVMFTAWHADMNLLYPSEVLEKYRPGHSAKRDVISDLYEALSKYDIDLILYVHPSDGHDFPESDQEKLGWHEGGDYKIWNDFINDVFAELVTRYRGKILGYWFDGGFPVQVQPQMQRLKDTFITNDPNVVLIQNEAFDDNFFLPWAEFGCRERINPPYKCHAIQAAPVITSGWWAKCAILEWTPELAFQYLVLQSSCHGLQGGGTAFSTGPYVGGGWEPGVEDFFKRLGEYVEKYQEAILDTRPSEAIITEPGTPLFIIDPPSQSKIFKPLFTATDSKDGLKTYLHILYPPYESTFRLPAPANGKKFTSAKMMLSNTPVNIAQNENELLIDFGVNPEFSLLDTVIVLQ